MNYDGVNLNINQLYESFLKAKKSIGICNEADKAKILVSVKWPYSN